MNMSDIGDQHVIIISCSGLLHIHPFLYPLLALPNSLSAVPHRPTYRYLEAGAYVDVSVALEVLLDMRLPKSFILLIWVILAVSQVLLAVTAPIQAQHPVNDSY